MKMFFAVAMSLGVLWFLMLTVSPRGRDLKDLILVAALVVLILGLFQSFGEAADAVYF